MQYCWVVCLLVSFVRSQETVRINGLIDVEPSYPPFSFSEEGKDWTGLCTTGRYQSPIDISDDYSNLQIVTAANSTFRELQVSTPPIPRSNLSLQMVQGLLVYWLFSTTIEQEILGAVIRQTMLESHVTVPAEHTYNGLRYPLELHVVYALSHPDGNIVAGMNLFILYKEGRADPFLADLINPNRTTIDLTSVFPASGVVDDYFYYIGSVDVPWPECWEPIAWYMPNYILEASPEQIQYFSDPVIKDLSFDNGKGVIRALQPLNDRAIYHYITPRDSSFLS